MLYPLSSKLHTLILVFISGSFQQATTVTFAHWWFYIFPISSTFINWNSSIKKSCRKEKLSLLYLFTYSVIYIGSNSWVFILFHGLYIILNLLLIILMLKLFQIWLLVPISFHVLFIFPLLPYFLEPQS